MMTVRYQTAYDLYEITSKTASEMTFCVYMENTAYIITGIEGGGVKRLHEPNICDHVTAVRRGGRHSCTQKRKGQHS